MHLMYIPEGLWQTTELEILPVSNCEHGDTGVLDHGIQQLVAVGNEAECEIYANGGFPYGTTFETEEEYVERMAAVAAAR